MYSRCNRVWFFAYDCLYNSKGLGRFQSLKARNDNAFGAICMRKLTLALLCVVQCLALVLLPLTDLRSAQAETDEASAKTPPVVINEIHYDPRLHAAGVEYVELYNAGAAGIDLLGWSLGKGVDYVFPAGAWLPPGGYVLVARNPLAVQQVYGASALGPFSGKLSNDGDSVLLRDRDGQIVEPHGFFDELAVF